MLFFVGICLLVPHSVFVPEFPVLWWNFVSSFSVNNCTVHVTTLVMRITILYRYSAYEWSFWFITKYQQSYNYRGYQKKSGCKHFITSWLHIEKNEPEMFTANKIYGKYRKWFFPDLKKNRKIWNRQKSELRLCRTRHQFGVALPCFLQTFGHLRVSEWLLFNANSAIF